MKGFELKDIIDNLIGPILPIGESNYDNKSLNNLNDMIELVEQILNDICYVSHIANRGEASIVACRNKAEIFINTLSENYN